ncbi:inorganic phosphate transporter [Bacillus sp. FJAT-42376]|uniref:inorganic phosphate transporter n=1 Tax=Bacillus sp. FJAT-42376 TaxID=2014076 RepID=UPI000F515EEE|nr:inorganic phosphate transporter [Bacillus sp. FJAT-42376]AZB42872.1 inorganic phosphate transporter [Bacillus sp. FJAT-42376]
MLEAAAVLLSLFFAMNIGASGAAASMGVAYGSGAINRKVAALILCGIGVILGAVLGGGEVVKTISSGIIPKSLISIDIVLVIIGSAAISLFMANLMGIPLSTSEVTVGAVIGVGVAFHALYIQSILVIMMFWVLIPIVAFLITYFLCKAAKPLFSKLETKRGKLLIYLLIAAGFFEAFSAGMNNVANAVGPLVAASVITVNQGVWMGGLFVAAGAILLGGRVLETNGKKITNLSKTEGIVISSTGALLVILSSLFGLPVPLTQVTSTSIMSAGAAKSGAIVFQRGIVKKIVKVWIVSPLVSLAISYVLVKVFIQSDFYSTFSVIAVMAATLGVLSLMKAIQKEKRSVHENGGGI